MLMRSAIAVGEGGGSWGVLAGGRLVVPGDRLGKGSGLLAAVGNGLAESGVPGLAAVWGCNRGLVEVITFTGMTLGPLGTMAKGSTRPPATPLARDFALVWATSPGTPGTVTVPSGLGGTGLAGTAGAAAELAGAVLSVGADDCGGVETPPQPTRKIVAKPKSCDRRIMAVCSFENHQVPE